MRPKVSPFLERGGRTAAWSAVRLPHDAMIDSLRSATEGPGNAYFPSGVWDYRKTFVVSESDRGKRLFVEFEGVYRDATVTVNGNFAGHHPYGYTGFTVPIDHLVRFDCDNEIRVEVTAQQDARWYSGGGIYRNVKLVVGNSVHVALDSLHVTTPDIDDDVAVVQVQADIDNDGMSTLSTSIVVEISDATGSVVASETFPMTSFPRRSTGIRMRLAVRSPQRWSLDSPTLYTCRLAVRTIDGVEVDRDETTFGIRTLQLDALRGLRINGETVKLRGACIHHDNGVIGGATVERADGRRIEVLKAAGFNAIRSAHHPASKALLNTCDRLGVLVMDEAFDQWTHPKMQNDYARVFMDWWERDVDAMVRKDRNHPSVVLYSIGNEIPDVGNPAGAELGRRIAARVRALDNTRFVTNGVNPIVAVGIESILEMAAADVGLPSATDDTRGGRDEGEDNAGVNTVMARLREALPKLLMSNEVAEKLDEAFSYLDVCGYNYSDARYATDAERVPNRVIVGTETHNTNIVTNWPKVLAFPHVIGDFTWTGWDYLGEVGVGRVEYGDDSCLLMGDYPWLTAWCADIDILGHRRTLSYLREIVFGLRSEPYISVRDPGRFGTTPTHVGLSGELWTDGLGSWSWPAFEGRPVTVDVMSDADEIELLVNGRVVGRQASGQLNGYQSTFQTTFEMGDIVAVAYRNGAESARTALRSGSSVSSLDARVDRAQIRADDTDLAFIEIGLVDEHGNIFHAADRPVTVAIDGPGVLQGFGSANPKNTESFVAHTHGTFQGRALAAIRPNGSGTITVTVSADNLASKQITIVASSAR